MMTAGMLDNLISHMAKRVLELIKDEKNNDEVLNMKQAAKVIGVAPGTLAKYSNLGEIQCFLIGNRRMFKRKHLDEWIKKNVPGIFKFPKEGTVNG